ncbi:MAG: flavodoxin family protein [Clostridiales bacterium]|jgi:multimeric flavodoxin WrbA|nr:flavodoxin family protein [Clostridiales bacterium]
MKVIIVSGSPKSEGLSCSCVEAARTGVLEAGAECEVIKLHNYKLSRCAVCDDGWGICQKEHKCAFGIDGFSAIQDKLSGAEALVLVSPVYWGDITEDMKAFFDRYRRCEATLAEKGGIAGKSVLIIAAPGGSGNGLISCLEQMDRLCSHLRAKVFDFVGVNRRNREYKLEAITRAAFAMVKYISST